ncbi:hypothetical protein OG819_48945 [Streptomyces sp. NBC_01549]|uniref:hypothetical protein n=1 Tax=unclassified Streptomyces TaxID=2593676 RepID=UPI002251C0B7|nr:MULTISPECIES: hypothetical protein [unclassified Streptomyces]MCX4597254.1 hypothetical protein [Streptomyces sp. NBC_01549]
MAASQSEHLKSLIISTAQELWEDKAALGKFLEVVWRSKGFVKLADALEQSGVRPANATWRLVVDAPPGCPLAELGCWNGYG